MKTIIFSIALLWAIVVQGQSGYVWTTINTNHSSIHGHLFLDSVSYRSECSYYADSVIYYFSGWDTFTSEPFYYLYTGSTPIANSSNSFTLNKNYLDSCGGKVTYKWSIYGQTGTYYLGPGYGIGGIDVCNGFLQPPVTSITSAVQQQKQGTVTIYDSQGRFVKTSQVANYTEGLQPGQLYIYNAVYYDNTIDKGKILLE